MAQTDSSTEAPNEKHNRICLEIVDKIITEYPGGPTELHFVVLESLLFAFLTTMTSKLEPQLKLLDILVAGVRVRLAEKKGD